MKLIIPHSEVQEAKDNAPERVFEMASFLIQETILNKIALHFKKPFRLAQPEEESNGIDGFIGDKPITIMPMFCSSKKESNEACNSLVVFYQKKKSHFEIEFDETGI